jgi:hypothetical protein
VRLNNNELAEIYQNGKWIPICGHWFWNNNKGATLFCQQLGYKIGIVKQESIARQVPLPDDGFRIGECETNDIWGQCTGGCNDHTIGGTHCSDCRSGAMAGLRIECSDGNHYRLYVLNKFSMILLTYLGTISSLCFDCYLLDGRTEILQNILMAFWKILNTKIPFRKYMTFS